jgi:hypothetical protein
MNVRQLSADRLRLHPPGGPRNLSRREFVRGAGGAIAAGAALGSGLLRSQLVSAAAPDEPVPIPAGTPALGGAFHLYGPTPDGSFDPIDAEPSLITNFNGVVGLAYISGMVTRTNISTGARVELPYKNNDMRFMQGVYRGVDGKPRQGTFALI